jgi:DNA-directed RNA polymerase alpha subunit
LYFREDYGYYEAKIQKEFKWWKEYFAGKEHIIPLDTDYSPVKGDGVNFQVNSVVTGLEKEEEELKLTITTTGTISPRQALCQALEIIIQINDKIKNELVK